MKILRKIFLQLYFFYVVIHVNCIFIYVKLCFFVILYNAIVYTDFKLRQKLALLHDTHYDNNSPCYLTLITTITRPAT